MTPAGSQVRLDGGISGQRRGRRGERHRTHTGAVCPRLEAATSSVLFPPSGADTGSTDPKPAGDYEPAASRCCCCCECFTLDIYSLSCQDASGESIQQQRHKVQSRSAANQRRRAAPAAVSPGVKQRNSAPSPAAPTAPTARGHTSCRVKQVLPEPVGAESWRSAELRSRDQHEGQWRFSDERLCSVFREFPPQLRPLIFPARRRVGGRVLGRHWRRTKLRRLKDSV